MRDQTQPHARELFAAALSIVFLACMWFYVDRILVGYQVADAAAHNRPRGNLSDLYPRWLGSRELLLHHRNPYSDELTREIQAGYYGRPLDPSRPDDPKDQQGFAYPVYVVFLLSPLLSFPFHVVQVFFHWFLIVMITVSLLLWLRSLQWKVSFLWQGAFVCLALGSVPAVQGIKLQQLTVVVAALLSAAAAAIAGGWLLIAGMCVALATIKPQLVWPLAGWLLLWSVADWRRRRRFAYSFLATLAVLLVASEIVLPGWWRLFLAAIRHYHHYTQNESVLDQLVNWRLGRFGGTALALGACVPVARTLWRSRSLPDLQTGPLFALVLALTVLIVPMYAPYNQVLLLPAVMFCWKTREIATQGPRRVLMAATAVSIAWQWIAAGALALMWFASPDLAMRGWKLPFYATFALPVLVFVLTLVLVNARMGSLPQHETAG